MAAAGVPWRTEALAYRSDLARPAPRGTEMPRAVGVFDLDEESNAVWLEEVPVVPADWDLDRYARAGTLLGPARGQPPGRRAGGTSGDARLAHADLLRGSARGAGAADAARRAGLAPPAGGRRLRRASSAHGWSLRPTRAEACTDELAAMPWPPPTATPAPTTCWRGQGSDDFVLIDYGFWGPNPIGFDLAQLLVGDVQVGGGAAADLAEVEDAILESYVDGLRAEGCDIPLAVVRRAHALQLLLFTGLSTLPVEFLEAEPTPELHQVAAEARAKIARFSLDLLDATTA